MYIAFDCIFYLRSLSTLSPRVDPRAEANRETSPPVACGDAIAANAPHASVATVTTAARAPKDRRGASTSERSHASSSPSSVARSWVLASVPSSAARSLAPIVRPFEADMTSETRSRSFTLAVDGARVANWRTGLLFLVIVSQEARHPSSSGPVARRRHPRSRRLVRRHVRPRTILGGEMSECTGIL